MRNIRRAKKLNKDFDGLMNRLKSFYESLEDCDGKESLLEAIKWGIHMKGHMNQMVSDFDWEEGVFEEYDYEKA